MRHARSWFNLLLLVAPVGVLCLFAALMVRRVWNYLNSGPRLASVLSVEATRALGREVRVRSVVFKLDPWNLQPNRPNRVELGGVSVAQGLQPESGSLAQAEKVVIDFDLRQALLARDIHVPLVNGIFLFKPQAHLARDASGSWNVAQLLKPSTAVGRQFTDNISFRDGVLYYRDDDLPRPPGIARRRLKTRVDHLNGVVLLREDRSTSFNISGVGAPDLLGEFHVTGIGQAEPRRINARLTADALNFANIGLHVLPPASIHVVRGTGNVDLALLYEPPIGIAPNTLDLKSLDTHGTVALKAVTIVGPWIKTPVNDLTGVLTVAPDSVLGHLNGQFAGASFDVQGRALNVREAVAALRRTAHGGRTAAGGVPSVALQGTIRNAEYGRIARAIDLSAHLGRVTDKQRNDIMTAFAQGDVDFRYVGPLMDPTAAFRAHVQTARYERYRADDADLRVFYAHNAVDADARGVFARGLAAVRGHVVTDPRRAFEIEAHGRNLQLGAFNGIAGPIRGGRGQLDLAMQGERFGTPSITAQAEATDVTDGKQKLHSVYAYATTVGGRLFRWNETNPAPDRLKKLRLRTLRIEDPKGFALGSGTVDLNTQRLDLTLDADELDLGALAATVRSEVGGTASRISTPKPTGIAKPDANPDAKTPPGIIDFNALQGTGYLRTHIGGTLKQPEISGQVSLYALQAGRAALDSASADFNLNRQALVINTATARRYPGHVSVTGKVTGLQSKDPKLDLTANLANVDVTDMLELARRPQTKTQTEAAQNRFAVAGSLFSGPFEIGGSVHNVGLIRPVRLRLEGASINGLPLQRAEADAFYDHAGLHLSRAELDTAAGTITATGDAGKDFLSLTVLGHGLSLEQLTSALPYGSEPDNNSVAHNAGTPSFDRHALHGVIGFQAQIGGTPQSPQVSGHITADSVGYTDFTLGDIQGNARYADRRVMLQDVSVREPNRPVGQPADINIPGFAYNSARGTIAGQVRWNDVPLQRLTELLTSSVFHDAEGNNPYADTVNALAQPIVGHVSGTLDLSGTRRKPVSDVTLNVTGVKIKDQEITSITGSARFDTSRLQIPSPDHPEMQLRLVSPDAAGSVSDPTQIVADNITVVRDEAHPDDATVDADVSAYHINLAQLRNWLPTEVNENKNENKTVDANNRFRSAARQVSGTGNVFFMAHGTLKNPAVKVSADLDNLSYKGFTVDKINLSSATITEPQIQFNDIEFTKLRVPGDANSEKFIARLADGKIDFSWKAPFIAKDARCEIDADVPEQDLKVLEAFTRPAGSGNVASFLAADTAGVFSAHAHVGGPLDQLQPSGSLNVRASQLHFTNVHTGIKDLAAQLKFENGNVTVAPGFSGYSYLFAPDKSEKNRPEKNPSGGPISLYGSLPLFPPDSPANDSQIVLSAPDVKIDEAPLPGTITPGGRGSGSLRGDANLNIMLRRSFTKPIIAGSIGVSNMTLTPPSGFAAGTGGGFALPINPEFDLTLNVGKNVRIANPLLTARVDGSIRLTGNLFKRTPSLEAAGDTGAGNSVAQLADIVSGRPTTVLQPSNLAVNLLGELTVREGRLTLPTARFKLLPPGTQAPGTLLLRYPDYDPSQPGQPVLGVNVNIAAQSSMVLPTSTTITGRKLYQVTIIARGPVTGLAADPATGKSRLTLSFQTDPPDFSSNQQVLEQQVASTLGGSALEGSGRNSGQVITQQVTNVLTNSVIPGLFDRPAGALGLEDLAFNYDPVQRLSVIVSRHIFGPLYVTYNRSLGAAYETYEFKASLRFSSRYQLSYDTDDQNEQRILLEGFLKF